MNKENLKWFYKATCKVRYLNCGNPNYEDKPGDVRIEYSPAENDLGVLVEGSWI